MAKKLNGKVALVTGASSGIGRATAFEMAAQGAKVVVTARRRELLDKLVGEITALGGEAVAVAADMADAEAPALLVAKTVEAFGGLDILVNNAGYGMQQLVSQVELADLRKLFEVNFFGVVALTRAALPELEKRKGAVVNVASVAGLVPMPLHAFYAASKFAVVGMSASLAFEAALDGVRVVTVCPGPVDTEFVDAVVGLKYDESLRTGAAKWFYDRPVTIAKSIVKAARRRTSGTVVPTWRSYVQVVISSLGPVTRIGAQYFVKKSRPAMLAGSSSAGALV
jgi:short-subunit dehydrogenase